MGFTKGFACWFSAGWETSRPLFSNSLNRLQAEARFPMNSMQPLIAVPSDQEFCKKPYSFVGAGRLTSMLWKTGDEHSGWEYRFNIVRGPTLRESFNPLFEPADLSDLVKLAQVMASVIADDGCLHADDRKRLRTLISDLDALTLRWDAAAIDRGAS